MKKPFRPQLSYLPVFSVEHYPDKASSSDNMNQFNLYSFGGSV